MTRSSFHAIRLVCDLCMCQSIHDEPNQKETLFITLYRESRLSSASFCDKNIGNPSSFRVKFLRMQDRNKNLPTFQFEQNKPWRQMFDFVSITIGSVLAPLWQTKLMRSHYGFEKTEDTLVLNLPLRVRTWLSLQLGSWLEEVQLLIHSTPNNSHFQTLQHWCPTVFVILQQ